MASAKRLEKISELIKRELGSLVQSEFEHSAEQLLTVTEVTVANDLLTASVKVSIWPQDQSEKIFDNLTKQTGFFQHLLNRRLKMRPVPKIVFELDRRMAEAGRVEELLEKVKNEIE